MLANQFFFHNLALQRGEAIDSLKKEVEDVRLQIEPLLRTKPVPRLFIKDDPNMDRDKAEKGQPDINKWSMYTAYRYPLLTSTLSTITAALAF